MILEIIIFIVTIYMMCSYVYLISKGRTFTWLFHDVMGWHIPDDKEPQEFDGCSVHTRCKFCGREIIRDSQGNWFEVTKKERKNDNKTANSN